MSSNKVTYQEFMEACNVFILIHEGQTKVKENKKLEWNPSHDVMRITVGDEEQATSSGILGMIKLYNKI